MDIRIESYQLLVAAKPQFPLSGDSILLGMRKEKYALDSELVEKAEDELERLNAVVAEKESYLTTLKGCGKKRKANDDARYDDDDDSYISDDHTTNGKESEELRKGKEEQEEVDTAGKEEQEGVDTAGNAGLDMALFKENEENAIDESMSEQNNMDAENDYNNNSSSKPLSLGHGQVWRKNPSPAFD